MGRMIRGELIGYNGVGRETRGYRANLWKFASQLTAIIKELVEK